MATGADQTEAARAADRAAFDRDLPEALGVIADLVTDAAQDDAFGLSLVSLSLVSHLRLAQGLAAYRAVMAPPVVEAPRPALSGDPTRPREVKGGPALQHFAPLGGYRGLGSEPELRGKRRHP